MITRLEIDGFKSFADFAVDIPVLAAIVGPNASGKSNMFDAMALLARLVTSPAHDALARGRGEVDEQFRQRGDNTRVDTMSFAVELLLNGDVSDDFGTVERLPHTRMRYEMVLERREDERGVLTPFIARESATPIVKGKDRWARDLSEAFAEAHLAYGASQWKVLATEERQGRRVFSLKGRRGPGAQGRNALIPAEQARASVLRSITTALEFPLLFAVRHEIAQWRFLQLEPSALRMPSDLGALGDHLTSPGDNLALVLEGIRRSSVTSGTSGLDALASDLVRVIRGFSGIEVVQNEARGQVELSLLTRDGGKVSARVASDGTLRLLAILAALYETGDPGVLCLEEPENGINPQRLTAMLDVMRDLVTDPTAGDHQPADALAQVILSSHSPLLTLHVRASELLVLDSVTLIEPDVGASRISRVRQIATPHVQEPPLLGDDNTWSPLPPGAQAGLTGITQADAERLVHQG